ncbi:MAG: hypothetical protein AKCLJLPJ_00332 [Fimbriimonadales bacterium]|nr:MAG: hypothetical protein EDM73_01605 [Armatimonadota bacterium]MBV6502288.1 hypothetical protein [Fimbriimonadales bacterium]MCE7899724.1 hypothetical protein [Armatimonadetes bacterium ATM1]MDL1927579.1 hypothetical protein [Fimbriimonadia bacterium ATM]MBC6970898.1 hypothetical protein [Armatimonadota bacterium]
MQTRQLTREPGSLRAADIVNFKVQAGKADSMLAGRAAAVEALRSRAPGLVSATLVELGNGEYLDIMVWDTMEQAQAAEEIAASTEGFASWGDAHVAAIGPRYLGTIRSSIDE